MKWLRKTIPVFGVFALSGVMHEYFLYCAAGPAVYWGTGAAGWQLLFFLLQPVGIHIGDTCFSPGWPGRIWAIAFMVLISYLFVMPYLLCDYLSIAQIRLIPLAMHVFRRIF